MDARKQKPSRQLARKPPVAFQTIRSTRLQQLLPNSQTEARQDESRHEYLKHHQAESDRNPDLPRFPYHASKVKAFCGHVKHGYRPVSCAGRALGAAGGYHLHCPPQNVHIPSVLHPKAAAAFVVRFEQDRCPAVPKLGPNAQPEELGRQQPSRIVCAPQFRLEWPLRERHKAHWTAPIGRHASLENPGRRPGGRLRSILRVPRNGKTRYLPAPCGQCQ